MASVQYLIDLIEIYPEELHEKQEELAKEAANRNYCATLIQKTWRCFVCRKRYLKVLRAVTIIQSYLRGWMIRQRREEFEEMHKKDLQNLLNYKSAVLIQATWRGYITRKYMKDKCIKHRIAERKEIIRINSEMQEMIKTKLLENKKLEVDEMSEEYKKQVILILFKCHHFIRTYSKKGVYSCHDSNQLSIIEKLMKSIPFEKYMNEVHRVYYEEMEKDKYSEKNYTFTSKKLRRYEDLFQLRDQRNDVIKYHKFIDKNIHDKPFNLSTKIHSDAYQKELLTSEKYSRPIECVNHNENIKSKNISTEGFILNTKSVLDSTDIAYHIDFWEKHLQLN